MALQHDVLEGRSWYVSTLQLQLASMRVCRVVRGSIGFHLTIDKDTPHIVCDGTFKGNLESVELMEVPVLRVWRVTWDDPERLLRDVVWPDCLRELSMGDAVGQSLEGMVWPSSLEQLTLGDSFRHPLEGVM